MLRPFDWFRRQSQSLAVVAGVSGLCVAALCAVGVTSPRLLAGQSFKRPVTSLPEAEEPEEAEDPNAPEAEEQEAPPELAALDSVPVPEVEEISQFVKSKREAIALGKALFWDMQVGGDGRTACASCHFQAGADNRTKNTLAPRTGTFRGANYQLKASDFPFHRLSDPHKERSDDNPVIFDTSEVVGSQGVIKKNFVAIVDGSEIDRGTTVPDPVFHINGTNARQVTGRNAPTVINAIFNDRQFWDGRANRFFNGVNPFGDMDSEAKVWAYDSRTGLTPERILLDNASLASQAVGPPNNDVEMSWNGRTFPQLGQKMLQLKPLALQKVHEQDSVLGRYAKGHGQTGFADEDITYADLVRKAFYGKWWRSRVPTPNGDTQMEANFSLFWGLSIMLYERTLVSDDSPFDRYMHGDEDALSDAAKTGLRIFTNQGKCVNCHSGPEFTGAAISQLRGVLSRPDEPMVEFMKMQAGQDAFYDSGFYNIGVRPTAEDLGVGGGHPTLGPWSLARRIQQGQRPDLNGRRITIGPNDRLAVDGAFKTPTLRNVELTGPYMHNGGMKSLKEVVEFYARGADFFEENLENLDPDVDGIGHIRGREDRINAVVKFLESLTDDRVRYEKAPFDHPELVIPNGHTGVSGGVALDDKVVLPAVGRNGGKALKAFENVLK